ncbi:MAG: rRNA maturation RNAse YbeY [Candidatus Paceibacterota bacterium]|jgi:rRNA maturation RNase YbeY
MPLAIANLTKKQVSDLFFAKYKKKILGEKYELSLVFCGSALARQLNKERRGKDKIANILSFPLTKNSGEIFIKLPLTDFSAEHLFIHGLLHLAGLTHGSKMETEEKRFLSSIKNGQSTNHRGARRRDRVGAARRLRD